MDSATVLNATLPVYLMMLAGALVRKFGWFPQEAEKGTTNIIVRLLTPCLAFERIVDNPVLNDVREVILAATLGYVLIAAHGCADALA